MGKEYGAEEADERLFPETDIFTTTLGPTWREPAAGGPGRNFSADPVVMKPKILDGLASGLFPGEIAQALGIVPGTIRFWRQQDVEFDQMCVEAESLVTDQIEREAIRRAVRGVLEPVVHKGEVVMVNGEPLMSRRYSDSLLQFLLKGRRSEVYGDKSKVDTNVSFDLEGSKAALAEKLQQAADRIRASRQQEAQ